MLSLVYKGDELIMSSSFYLLGDAAVHRPASPFLLVAIGGKYCEGYPTPAPPLGCRFAITFPPRLLSVANTTPRSCYPGHLATVKSNDWTLVLIRLCAM